MNTDDTGDERMRALFQDAVSDVEPRDGLAEVRRRTHARRTSKARRWAPVLVGAGAVAATVVAATFVVNEPDDGRDDQPPVAGSPSSGQTGGPSTAAAGLYFLADTATGPRLFREFQAVTVTTDPEQKVLLALQRLTEDVGPRDPNYRTMWPSDSFDAVRIEDDRIIIELGTGVALQPQDGSGAGLLGVQQAVYTAEAALGDTLPVAFELDGTSARWVLGVRVPPLVDRMRSLGVVAPVNISDPAEQLTIEDDTLKANGTVAANVETGVEWSLLRDGDVVLEGPASLIDITGPDARATLGAPGWETDEIDLSELAPGDYVFAATVTAPGQTSDSSSEFSDTRTITVG